MLTRNTHQKQQDKLGTAFMLSYYRMCFLTTECVLLQQDKLGTAFMLVDSFAAGVIGMLCVAKTSLSSIRQLAEGLDFIQLQVHFYCLFFCFCFIFHFSFLFLLF